MHCITDRTPILLMCRLDQEANSPLYTDINLDFSYTNSGMKATKRLNASKVHTIVAMKQNQSRRNLN